MTKQRLFEILPGFLAWTTIALMFLLSWLAPVFVAIFIILFDIYWLLKTVYLSFHLRSTFSKMRKNLKIDWLEKLQQGANRKKQIANDERLALSDWQKIYHLIIIPFYKEPYEILKETFETLSKANYPKNKFIIVLGAEEKGGAASQESSQRIRREFGDIFYKFLITTHPQNLPGEIPGKGSNQVWAVKEVKKIIIDPLKIPYEKILLSVFDADTQISPEYFGRLSYVFLTCKKPLRSSFQPIPFFTNNIYEAPSLGRVISYSSTFWHMMQQSRPERLTTFSSHSMPFKAVIEIDYWNPNVVSEDSRIFWQCYLHYDGDWRTEPLLYPVSMDANVAPTFWQTLINLYKQQRRWGWGAENIPYMFKGFLANKKIPKRKKWYWSFHILESFHSWATNALMIFALGWLPIFLGGSKFNVTMLSYNLPLVTKWILNLAAIGIASSAVLGVILLPPKPKWFKWWHYFLYVIQWVFMPLTLIVFGAFPGLDAQTRLMLGGRFRLGFWPTPKHR